jgi:hypothetical protein
MAWSPADFTPTARGRQYAKLPPELDDLQRVAGRIRALSSLGGAQWADLAAYTEASYVRRAIAGDWPGRPHPDDWSVSLVCRPNLDVYSGLAGVYGHRHGNLRANGVAPVLERALAHSPVSHDQLYLPDAPVPPVSELAEQYGNPEGREVHFWPGSIRYRWLDRAVLAQRGVANRAAH